jgi:glutamyl-tRNA reductase
MESFSLLHCDMHRLLVDVTKHFQVEEGHYLVAHLVRVACGRGREEEVG